jgi:predicted ester cyclase
MSEKIGQNKALLRRIYEEMWNRHNPAAARALFARPESVERAVSEFLYAFPDLQHSVEELIGEGDRVVARFTARGTHTGQWKQYEPTGKPIQYTGVTLATVVGDKIVDHHTWWDTHGLIEQITSPRPASEERQ